MITAVIFDVDGTLVDSVSLHASAWQDAFRRFGKEVDHNEIWGQIGKGGDLLMPVFLSKEQIEKEGKEIEKVRKQIFEEKYMSQVKPLPGVRELFERLRADGRRIALASSAKQDELQVYKRIANIEDLLDEETSSDDAEKSKPEPDIFVAALERLKNPDPKEVIVVGDSPYDAEAAGKAGMRTIGVLSGGFCEGKLRDAGCIEIYRDPAHLLAEYEQSALGQR